MTLAPDAIVVGVIPPDVKLLNKTPVLLVNLVPTILFFTPLTVPDVICPLPLPAVILT